MTDQGAQTTELTKSMNAVIARVNEHHEFLTGLQKQIADRQAQAQAQSAGGAPGSPLGLMPGGAGGAGGFNDPNAQKASDAMRLMTQGMNFLDGGAGAAPAADTYAEKLADLTLRRLQSDISLTDVLKNSLAQGLANRAKAAVAGVLPAEFP